MVTADAATHAATSWERLSVDADRADIGDLYLNILKKCLTRYGFSSEYRTIEPPLGTFKRAICRPVQRLLASRGLELVRRTPFDAKARSEGSDWPYEAETMVGLQGLDFIQHCLADVLRNGVPGDMLEAGVWRGGVVIFMRAVLKVHGDTSRTIWAADSFAGYPKPNAERYPADEGSRFWSAARAAASLVDVQKNLAAYNLLDDQVRFLPGWFRDTLPTAPIERLALLRLDGVMYQSIWEALEYLYPKVSVGGYVIVDDYAPAHPQCVAAVDTYRAQHGLTEELRRVTPYSVSWQRLQ